MHIINERNKICELIYKAKQCMTKFNANSLSDEETEAPLFELFKMGENAAF